MITTAEIARNNRLIVDTIISSHTGIAYHVQGTPPHHGFSLLINVECACVDHYPWVHCTQQDLWSALPSE